MVSFIILTTGHMLSLPNIGTISLDCLSFFRYTGASTYMKKSVLKYIEIHEFKIPINIFILLNTEMGAFGLVYREPWHCLGV